MNDELLKAISKLLDEKLEPIRKEIEEIKDGEISSNLQDKMSKDIDYIKGYYYNRTQ